MPIDHLPPLNKVIEAHKLSAKKGLGQNFLLDFNLIQKITQKAGVNSDDHIIEIGPGPGGLTRAMLAEGAFVTVIEKDVRCLALLQEISDYYPGKLTILHDDALNFDITKIDSQGKPIKIIANLPYNIATQILLNFLLLDPWPPFYQSMTLMFQREVAKRITSSPGDPNYGRLSVLVNWRTKAHIAFDIPAQAFVPKPKVTSSVVHFSPKQELIPCSTQLLEKVTQAAFGQRRKMLRKSLQNLGGETLLAKAAIDGTRRAETVSFQEFIALAQAFYHTQ